MKPNRRTPILLACLLAGAAMVVADGNSSADEPVTFEKDVRPIFKAYCLDCHGAGEKLKGSLDLRLRRLAAQGGDGGPAFVAAKPEESLLLKRLKSGEMPPGEKKVPAAQIAVIEKWIAAGAPARNTEPTKLPPGIDISAGERAYWFFQPLRRPEPPLFQSADRVRTPVDAFVLANLREKGLAFAADADRLTLVRRAAFDLIGLPPSPGEVAEFLADRSEEAYEKMLDRLLASPRYGERWARHWLDVAGYADSDGNGSDDTPRPYAYKYRDWVIRALNSDLPLDQFIIDQLAGDELVAQPWKNLSPSQIDHLTATGFLRMAPDGTTGGGDPTPAANQVVADTLKIVGSALLGLTVGCAECHDHRYDPIPHVDYYRLRAVFEPALDPKNWRRPPQRLVSLYSDADRAKAAEIEAAVQKLQAAYNVKQQKFLAAAVDKELTKYAEPLRSRLRDAYQANGDKRTAEQKKLLEAHPSANISAGVLYQYNQAAADELKRDQALINAKRAERPVEDFLSVLGEVPGAVPATHLFYRGDYRQPKQAVKPGDLTIAAPEGQRLEIAEKEPMLATTGRRLALARHLTNGTHPLLGRVLANRIWLHHFGRGIVDTPGDFGVLGVRPTHPELLDWLAGELPRQGWSLKRMHKLLMTSTVYRQSSRRDPAAKSIDDDGSWYSRYPVRRLDAETLRDRLLFAAGRLDCRPFGPPVPIEEDIVGQVVAKGDSPRRSIYLQVRRTRPVSLLSAFDAPLMAVNCDRRASSTAATQSLMLMNSDFVLKHAGLFADRVRRETPTGFAKDLEAPFAAKLARPGDAWQYGYGAFDETARRVVQFNALPHWTGSAWQGGPALPDPKLGYAIVHAAGGHAGNDAQHAAIRRWVAPRDGLVAVTGKLTHPSPNGDGVRGRIVAGRAGLVGAWRVKKSEAATTVTPFAVRAGETLDFVVDCVDDVTSDSFAWTVQVKLTEAVGKASAIWDSARDFHGPATITMPQQIAYAWAVAYQRNITRDELELGCAFVARQLAHLRAQNAPGDHERTALTNLCQQLLSSNEFLYVD